MSNDTFSKELSFALDIVKQAGQVALNYFHSGVPVTLKSDNTPVTAADKECEYIIRQAISKAFPQATILGEEEGESNTNATPYKWIIDPIDGTYNFARGIPIFATLLALEKADEIVLGVVHNPVLNETFYAQKGSGAFKNGKPISVSDIDDLSKSHFLFGQPGRILEEGLWDKFTELINKTDRHRGFGDYLNFAYVFEGKAEVLLEVGLKPWDLAAMKILCIESGGKFSDLKGGDSIYTGSCLVSNGKVHQDCLQLLT